VSASAIYEGTVRHRRFAVRHHEFLSKLALAYIDLDELPDLLGGRLTRGRKITRFRRRDYLGEERLPLAEAVRDLVAERTGLRPQGPIRLLTNLSTLGHCFNPVSFYYCLDPADADRAQAVVAEVSNTPWKERHAYVLAAPPDGGADRGPVLSGDFDKELHVSPFMGMGHRYEWRLTVPAQTLSVHISSRQAGELAFDATLALRRRELTRASLAGLTARYPLNTVRILALIYARAALLKLRGVPVHPHPKEGHA
jgi:uncharacterized protein